MLDIVINSVLFLAFCFLVAGSSDASVAAGLIIVWLSVLVFATYIWLVRYYLVKEVKLYWENKTL